ncbi:MAG: transposase [Actinomycetia bacterium]|nr:transposase [Actinomycetes bacterium]
MCSRTDLPVAWHVTTDQTHESSQVGRLLDAVQSRNVKPETVTLDRGYDFTLVYEVCHEARGLPVIPFRKTIAVKQGKHRLPTCERSTWTFAGTDLKHKRTKWRCPTGDCQPKSLLRKASRLHPLIPRETKRWGDLYRGRASVEREIGRLKHDYALTPLRVRGLDHIQLHTDLTILALLSAALARARTLPLAT